MKRTQITTLLLLLLCQCVLAQSKYTDRLQADGKVTLHQSQAITDLVNGPATPAAAPKPATSVTPSAPSRTAAQVEDGETENLGQRMRANGYRIQVYSGDNSRKGKNEASALGRKVRNLFSELPVYTEFASPHWRCRVGDFRTYEEASEYLKRLRDAGGFAEAVIVRSKITIYY
ncbi:MAG: SPOR domain-containing protein [Bacteroidaceae bacterium]|nr:SPOR domain-containing protein [Bacteroidaceae bacterium]